MVEAKLSLSGRGPTKPQNELCLWQTDWAKRKVEWRQELTDLGVTFEWRIKSATGENWRTKCDLRSIS